MTTDESTDLVQRGIDAIAQVSADLAATAEWLAANRDHLPDSGPKLSIDHSRVLLNCASAEELATITRALADDAPPGTVRDLIASRYVGIVRSFGSVDIEVWARAELAGEA